MSKITTVKDKQNVVYDITDARVPDVTSNDSGKVLGVNENGAIEAVVLEGANVKSTGATSGQVLTADGSGGASWQTPSGGNNNYVSISSYSGTFTPDEITKLSNNDSYIVYESGSTHRIFRKKDESSSFMFFYLMNFGAGTHEEAIKVTIATRGYSREILKPYGTKIDSTGASNGQVLTANGSGGASWETPTVGSVVSGTNDGTNWTSLTIDGTTKNIPSGGGGSGTQLYYHLISLRGGNHISCITIESQQTDDSFIGLMSVLGNVGTIYRAYNDSIMVRFIVDVEQMEISCVYVNGTSLTTLNIDPSLVISDSVSTL